MWEVCETCGAVVGDMTLHTGAHTTSKPNPRFIDVKETQNASN